MPTPTKPDELKILEGTFRPDRDGDPTRDVVAEGEPAVPGDVRGEALAFWRQVVPEMARMGLVKERDAAALGMMCQWHARYRKLSRALDRCPVTGKGSGNLNKLLVAVAIAWEKFDRIAQRFGMTPADRAKMRQPANQLGGRKLHTRKRG